jgi:phytol kinase
MPPTEVVFEFLRKAVHLVSILIVLIYEFFGKETVLWVLVSFLVIMLFLDYFRLEHNLRIPFFYAMYRKNEANRFGGHIFFSLGAITAIALCSKEIAYVAVLMTTFGDMTGTLVGKFYGKRRIFYKIFNNDKSIEGSLSEFIIDFLIGMLILGNPLISLVMAFFATLTETAVSKIDDNLVVPVLSGFFGQIALTFLAHL